MLLEDLKFQTRHQHTALERINSLPETRDLYVVLLERFYGYVAPWETLLEQRLPADDPLRAGRAKTGWLEADLAFFGRDADRLAELPRCEDLPEAGSRAELLGACYVIEGSTLGGQFIVRHLREKLGVAPGEGDRYFSSYGPDVSLRWRQFREELMRHSSPENDPKIIASAQRTFDKLACWFAMQTGVFA